MYCFVLHHQIYLGVGTAQYAAYTFGIIGRQWQEEHNRVPGRVHFLKLSSSKWLVPPSQAPLRTQIGFALCRARCNSTLAPHILYTAVAMYDRTVLYMCYGCGIISSIISGGCENQSVA